MSDRLPYEEQLVQQWNDLPLPDEDKAWEDMKRRLDDDDDAIIPFWLRGCSLWGLLAVLVTGLGWWLIRPGKWGNKKQETKNVKTIDQKKDNHNKKINAGDTIHLIKNTGSKEPTGSRKDVSKNSPADSSSTGLHSVQKKSLVNKKGDIRVQSATASPKKKKDNGNQQSIKKNIEKNKQPVNKKEKKITESEQVDIAIQPGLKNKKTGNEPVKSKNDTVQTGKDSIIIPTTSTSKTDTVRKIAPDSIQKNREDQTVKTNEQKKDSSKHRAISFSAGIAIHQQLPVDGQKLTPYNSLGRKSSLADYIPSAYGRMYKNDKWFLQLEFRYGAPQYTKEFLYQQKAKLDTVGVNTFTTTTSSKLKKTFYHQLPFSFNYFVMPDWSIGTGIVWNKFSSAISERKVTGRNNATQVDSLLSNGIVKDKNDSVFAKSYLQAVFETQYRWRRFSIGARYSFGLQPFIKFTLPGGVQQEERNRSLQVFLRYEFWKSKTKR